MIISIIADCHVNKSSYKGVFDKDIEYMPFRTADFMRAFERVITQNINEIKPNLIVFVGDIYDNYDPANDLRTFFNTQIQRLIDADITTYIMVGNHDACKKHHALSPIKAFRLNGVEVIEEPELKILDDKIILLFPYSIEVEKGNVSIKKQFSDFVEKSKEEVEKHKDKTIMFFGHFGVKGAYIKGDSENAKKSFVNSSDKDISLQDLNSINANYIFLGDYHRHQILNVDNGFAMYTGSLEKTDMSEKDQIKGYIVYNDDYPLDEKMGKTKFIEYEQCRPMVEIKGSQKDITQAVSQLDSSLKGAIVKIFFVGNKKELYDFSIVMSDLKKDVIRKLKPIHIYYDQTITEDDVVEDLDEEIEILQDDNVNKDLVKKAIEEMIREKENDPDEITSILKLSQEIYEEAMEK